MIIIHIGLPKTASTLFLETIVKNTNVILICDILGEDLSNKMSIINPSYRLMSQNEKIAFTNDYFSRSTGEDTAAISEASFQTIQELDLDSLDQKKYILLSHQQ